MVSKDTVEAVIVAKAAAAKEAAATGAVREAAIADKAVKAATEITDDAGAER